MYQGKTTFVRSAPKPGRAASRERHLRGLSDNNPNDLSEVDPGIYGRYAQNSPYPPNEYEIEEIVVSGNRIPWWMWAIGGALALTAVKFVKR